MFRKIIVAAFTTGIVMGALAPAQAMSLRVVPAVPATDAVAVSYHGKKYSEEHYAWCAARYRSYDRHSNTYQPHYGPRKQCVSPY